MSASYPAIQRLRDGWGTGAGLQPVAVLIGGAAGVGKSTLAGKLQARMPELEIISTAILRLALRTVQPGNELLAQHTYDLGSIDAFVRQSRLVMDCVNQLLTFVRSERQLLIVEGSNLLPGRASASGVIVVEAYLREADAGKHARMLGGPTHDRALPDESFRMCRQIQDYVAAEAEARRRAVLDTEEAEAGVLALIEETLAASNA
jgi:2-phosphoglycerate kinase